MGPSLAVSSLLKSVVRETRYAISDASLAFDIKGSDIGRLVHSCQSPTELSSIVHDVYFRVVVCGSRMLPWWLVHLDTVQDWTPWQAQHSLQGCSTISLNFSYSNNSRHYVLMLPNKTFGAVEELTTGMKAGSLQGKWCCLSEHVTMEGAQGCSAIPALKWCDKLIELHIS